MAVVAAKAAAGAAAPMAAVVAEASTAAAAAAPMAAHHTPQVLLTEASERPAAVPLKADALSVLAKPAAVTAPQGRCRPKLARMAPRIFTQQSTTASGIPSAALVTPRARPQPDQRIPSSHAAPASMVAGGPLAVSPASESAAVLEADGAVVGEVVAAGVADSDSAGVGVGPIGDRLGPSPGIPSGIHRTGTTPICTAQVTVTTRIPRTTPMPPTTLRPTDQK